MKKILLPIVIGLSAILLLSGCVISMGSGSKNETLKPTIGQQLIDLQKAKDSGAINDSEYQAQKAKLLNDK